MSFSGSAGYRAASRIPAAEAALHAAYTRHIFARSSTLPSTSGFRFVSSLRGGYSNPYSHDELAWDHTGAAYVRSHYHRSGGYVSAQMSAGSFAVDTWVSIAATFDGANLRSYVNGALDGTSGGTSASVASDTEVTVNGASDYGGDPVYIFANGETAEQAIWDVVLTVDEIASLAKGFRATRVRPNNLVFYSPQVRGRQELVAGRTLNVGVGSENILPHPRVFG